MNLLVDPAGLPERGINTVIPVNLKQDLIEYTPVEYKTYRFGTILKQKFSNQLFSVHQYIVNIVQNKSITVHCEEPCVILQFTMNGYAHYELHNQTSHFFDSQTAVLYYLPAGTHCLYLNNEKFRCIQIVFSSFLLNELAEDILPIKPLIEDLKSLNQNLEYICPIQLNFHIQDHIQKLLKLQTSNGTLNIAMKSIVLTLVRLYFEQAVEDEIEFTALPQILHKDKMVSIRKTIMARPHLQECKLSVLSKKYYLNRKTISQNFYHLFQIHISEFLLQQILEKAIYLLLNTDMAIKDIAEELGYSTSSNFARAFTDYYHQSPFDVRVNRGLVQR